MTKKKACPESFDFARDKLRRKVYIRTFGWPMDASTTDD